MSKEYYAALQRCIEKNEEIARLREEIKRLREENKRLSALYADNIDMSWTEGGGDKDGNRD